MAYGYDEPSHIDMAYVYSVAPFHFYGPGQLQPTKASVGMQATDPSYPPDKSLASEAILPRAQRKSFSQLGGHAFITGGQPNQMVQHPPLYYWMEAVVLRVPGVSGLAWDVQVWLMRLLSVALMLPLPLLAWGTTRRLLGGRSAPPQTLIMAAEQPSNASVADVALLAAAIPLTVPNLIRDGASVTNDSLLIFTTSVLLYLLSRVLTGDQSRRTAGWIALALAAALWTKGYALVLPPIVLAAYLIGARSDAPGRGRRRNLGAPLAIAAAGAVIGGLWWLRNLIDYGTVQTDGYGPAFHNKLYGQPTDKGTLAHFIAPFVTGFVMRIWGGIGRPDGPSPGPFIIYGWFFLVVVGLVAAVAVKGLKRDRRRAVILIAAPVLTALVVAEGSFSAFHKWQVLAGIQGRYLYNSFVVVSALAALGWYRLVQPRVRASLTPIVVIGAIVTNAAAWILILRSWYEPARQLSFVQSLRQSVDSLLRWSPLPEGLTLVAIVVLPTVTSITTAVVTLRAARQADRRPPAPVAPNAPSMTSV